jgi:hypothetical protein
MISSEVERTLVKSPPELWAELSDPTSLARHLGELGEIEITRIEPEKTVEWVAEKISGTVSIKPSGWGTTVKLTALAQEPAAPEEPEARAEPGAYAGDPIASEPETQTQTMPSPEPVDDPSTTPPIQSQPIASLEPESGAEHEPEPREGFFARLFGRRRRPRQETEPSPAPVTDEDQPDPFEAVRRVLEPETFAGAHLFAAPQPESPATATTTAKTTDSTPIPEAQHTPAATTEPKPADAAAEPIAPVADIAAELKAAEEVDAEQVTAVLTAVLDRLGAAHHRPFSRS